MKTKLLAIFIFFFSFISLFSVNTNKKFYNINEIFGTSLREMASVCRDDDGFIWASSKMGIIRTTDSDYRIYQLPYKSANVINVRLSYGNGKLVAYTNNGQIFLYNQLYDRFDLYVDLRTVLKDQYMSIGKLVIDKDNALWISSSEGLCKLANRKLIRFNNRKLGVTTIKRYDNDNILLALRDRMCILNTSTFKLKTLFQYGRQLNVISIYDDPSDKKIWMGTNTDGLFFYDFTSYKMTAVDNIPKQPISVINESPDSTILVGTDGKGILELGKDGKSLQNTYVEDMDNPYSLRGNGVYDVFCGSDRRVWVVTYSGGLSFFDWNSTLVQQISHQINNSNSLGNNNVNSVLQDKKGDIWFATNNGVYRWRVATNQWESFYRNKEKQAQVFQALCEDDENRIWAGTYSSGFYLLDRETGRELAHYPNNQANEISHCKFVMSLYKDSQGDMWIGGVQNLICYLKDKKQFRVYNQQPMRSFRELAPGKMLLACTYSLILLDKESGKISYLAYCLAQDILAQGNDLWVATSGDGLLHYNIKSHAVRKITMDNGLPTNFVNSVAYEDGYIWLGTESGLCRYNPKDNSVNTFTQNMSFTGTSFNNNAVCRLNSGEMIWGTNNGAVMFNPDKLNKSQFEGKIFFQDISIAGNSIRENDKLLDGTPVNRQTDLSFRFNQNNLSLELLPIGISHNEIKFSWIMEGLDLEWSRPSSQQIISYSNIPNGSYKLRIKMYNSSLSDVIDERELNITIVPLYWQTWWFRLITLFAFIGIVLFALRTYVNRLKQRHNEDKIRFFANTAHDLRTSITLIKAPIQELIKEKSLSQKGSYYLNLAIEQSERLLNVATQLLDFQKVDAGKGQLFLVMVDIVSVVYGRKTMFESTAMKKNITLNFTSNRDEYRTAIDELKIEKVIDNLLSNAIKYSHDNSSIDIRLEVNDSSWKLEVTDHGLGISENAQKKLFKEFYRGDNKINSYMVGSGIGLLLVKNYVMMHGGEVSVMSKENEGSTFVITMPYKEVTEEAVIKKQQPLQVVQPDASSMNVQQKSDDKENRNEKSILVVDDNNDLRNFIKSTFESEYKVLEADNGKSAWNLLQNELPDLIVSDVMMPEMDGFELCKLIKSTFDTSHIPVILLTSLCERSNQLEGLGFGAEDYITKPFDVSILKQRIMSLIRNRDIIKQRTLSLAAPQKRENEKIFTNELNDSFVKKAVEILKANISNIEFDKESFANEMNVSPSLLYKKLKALTGQSPTDFIRDMRMNRAMELLQSRSYSITEVSEMCGYGSISYFSTVFKKNFGKSPTEV